MKLILDTFKNFYYRQSLTTQIILLIIMVFTSFFVVQLILNTIFFPSFYQQRETAANEAVLIEYVSQLEQINDENFFDIQFEFTSNYNINTIILDEDFRFLTSRFNRLTIEVLDASGERFRVELADYYTLQEGDFVVGVITPTVDDSYVFTSLFINNVRLISGPCFSDCINISGEIQQVEVPRNLNYIFMTHPRIQREQARLSMEFLRPYRHLSGWRYESTDGPIDIMVYVNPIQQNYVMTIFTIENTSSIVSTLASYQNFVYLSALLIILLWSFRIGKVASKPIRNVEVVAREISQLNFDAEAIEFKSKEATSLSKSINLISRNLRSALATLNQNNQELMELYKEQSDQVDLKKRLVSSISHELKTPLMIIQVTIQGILDGIVPQEDIHDEFNVIMQEINKSTLMIQDLLQIYRLDSKETELKIERFNFTMMVRELAKEFGPLIKQYRFSYLEDIEDNLYIDGDYKLMQRVLSNFMTNAVKYTPKEETIMVDVYTKEQFVYFEMINYGVTIPDDQINNLWTPFYRLDDRKPDKEAIRGSGIGLYLVSEVLKAHQFDYGLENVKGGVKVFIIIPQPYEKKFDS